MRALLGNDFIFILAFSVVVVVIVYINVDPLIESVKTKGVNSINEVLRLLDLMFVETTRTRIIQLMLLLSLGSGLLVFLLLWPHFWIGIVAGSIIAIAGWSLPPVIVKNLFNSRCSKVVDQMVDGLTIMANGVKAGLSVPQSMERVVENLPNPISQELDLVLSQIRIGRSVEEALIEFGERIPKADVQMFVTAINILKETGGNLAETFTTIVLTIRERQKIEKKIEAMTAQGMMQGLIVSLVPVALILLFFVIDKGFIMPLFTTPIGLILFLVIIGLVVIGGITMRKLVKIEV